MDNSDCQKFLKKEGIDPGKVKNAVNNMQPWDATKSTISRWDAGTFDPQEDNVIQQGANGTRIFQNTTEAYSFSQHPETMADASVSSNNVYFRPASFHSWFMGGFKANGITPLTIVHESLHNLLHQGDERLNITLGGNRGAINPSADIQKALGDNNCGN